VQFLANAADAVNHFLEFSSRPADRLPCPPLTELVDMVSHGSGVTDRPLRVSPQGSQNTGPWTLRA